MAATLFTASLWAAVPVAISALAIRGGSDYGTPAQQACAELQSQFPQYTHFPNSSMYTQDNTAFWSEASVLGPSCDFSPSCANDLARAVTLLKHYQSPFAIRGGGHMPIAGYNNIDSSGVLISCSNLTQLEMGDDSVHIGPGNRWLDVYKYLETSGKVAVGGRYGNVGVPGFILGGGWSFYSPQYGWANNNIKSVTGVLADGSVVTATSSNAYADLFWALRGGANSFALITDFEVKTYNSPVVTLGITNYEVSDDMPEKWAAAVYDYAVNGGLDKKSSLISMVSAGSNNTKYERTYQGQFFYDGDDAAPKAFASYSATQFNATSTTFTKTTMYEFAEEQFPIVAAAVGLRNRFMGLHLHANKEAIKIVEDTFIPMAYDMLGSLDFWAVSVSNTPVPKHAMQASMHSNGDHLPYGDPMGVPVDDYFKITFPVTYSPKAEYEPIVSKFLEEVDSAIKKNLAKAGLSDTISKFLYLNDADKFQDVWGGYPVGNVKKLQSIREKYDPDMVFTKLMPGGWKVADARV